MSIALPAKDVKGGTKRAPRGTSLWQPASPASVTGRGEALPGHGQRVQHRCTAGQRVGDHAKGSSRDLRRFRCCASLAGPGSTGSFGSDPPGLDAEFHLIPILQDVISPNHLTVEGTAAPHAGRLELPVKVLVDLPGKLLNGGPFLQREG
jgi:hypothetical protein